MREEAQIIHEAESHRAGTQRYWKSGVTLNRGGARIRGALRSQSPCGGAAAVAAEHGIYRTAKLLGLLTVHAAAEEQGT